MKLTISFKARAFIVAVLIVAGLACAKKPANETTANNHSPAPDNVRSSKDVVKVSAAGVSIAGAGKADATIKLTISPGYHVNANPATFPYLIATQATPGTAPGLTAEKPVYPTAEKKKFAFADEPLAVYEGEAEIKLPLQADGSARGAISLPITLRVQACDQEKCFPPDTLNTAIAVEVK